MARNTKTGKVLERMVLPSLEEGGYESLSQQKIGTRLSGRKHIVDVVAQKGSQRILISLKWQQSSGTAEEKIAYEIICLVDAIKRYKYTGAYLVLGGDGWSLRDFYIKGGLNDFIKGSEKVKLVTLEHFIRIANQGKL